MSYLSVAGTALLGGIVLGKGIHDIVKKTNHLSMPIDKNKVQTIAKIIFGSLALGLSLYSLSHTNEGIRQQPSKDFTNNTTCPLTASNICLIDDQFFEQAKYQNNLDIEQTQSIFNIPSSNTTFPLSNHNISLVGNQVLEDPTNPPLRENIPINQKDLEILSTCSIRDTILSTFEKCYECPNLWNNEYAPLMQNKFTANHNKICPLPSDYLNFQLKIGIYKGIDLEEMKTMYGTARVLNEENARYFYNMIASANKKYGLKALELPHLKPLEVAKSAVETRHHSRLYVRSVGSLEAEQDAEYIDRLRFGHSEGLSTTHLFKKYNYNATTIIEKAGSTNEAVNSMVAYLPENRLLRNILIWSGVKTGII